MGRVKYSEFVDRVDVEALMEAIGFTPEYEDNRGNRVGYCIWPENHMHGDTTGKFAIHPEKKAYNCYVCGGGSLLSLVMEINGWDSETAENYLRQFAGDKRDDLEFVEDFLNAFAADAERRIDVMPYFNGRVLEKYEPAYEYGEAEGLNAKAIDHFNVLYAAEAVKRSPGKGKFTDVPDYVGPSIIWPHYWNKRLVGWQNRWLSDDRPEFVKKWTNTVDFPREETLYGYQFLGPGKVYVVESAKSVLKLSMIGLQAVATFGSNATPAQLRLLRGRLSGLVLCPDNDKGGEEWFQSCYDYLVRYVPLEGVAPFPGEKADVAGGPDGPWSNEFVADWLATHTVDLTVPHM